MASRIFHSPGMISVESLASVPTTQVVAQVRDTALFQRLVDTVGQRMAECVLEASIQTAEAMTAAMPDTPGTTADDGIDP